MKQCWNTRCHAPAHAYASGIDLPIPETGIPTANSTAPNQNGIVRQNKPRGGWLKANGPETFNSERGRPVEMLEHKMLHLFGGRMDAYGLDGDPHPVAVRGQVTHELIRDHLEGRQGVGIYPMWHQAERWWVKWGCCDIDTGDWSEAYGLAVCLRAMGFAPFVERSRSKGWHVWVFSDGPVEAKNMRRALKVAYATVGLQAREANPKAESLRPDQLGNYVRLPFKGALQGEVLERQVFTQGWDQDSDGIPVSVATWFNEFESGFRAHPSMVEYWADKWKEPERQRMTKPQVSEAQLRTMFRGMRKDLFDFVRDGPPGDGDRSEALVALAFKLKRAGYSPQEIYSVVDAADRRWGKYHLRPDGEIYLLDIVERTL